MSLIRSRRVPVPPPLENDTTADVGLWQYMRPIRAKWLLGVLVAISSTSVALSIPQVLAWVIDHLVGSDSPSRRQVLLGGAIMIALGLLQSGLMFLRRMLIIDTSTTVEMTMRMRLFDQLMRLPLSFHDAWGSGQLLTRSTSDLALIRRWVSFGSVQAITSGAALCVGIFYLSHGSGLLALIFLASVPVTLVVLWRFQKKMKALTRKSQQQSGDLATKVEESVQGIRVLKALGQGSNALDRFKTGAAELMDTEMARSRAQGSTFVATSTITAITLAISLWVGLRQVASGSLSVGELTAFFATIALLSPHVERASQLMGMWLDARVAVDRHREVMSTPAGENIVLVNGATVPAVSSGEAASLTFEHATFAYEDAAAPVLSDISLDVRPGEILALVGPTGSGKSTLLQLLPRLYELDSGSIFLDEQDIAQMDLPELRSAMSIAFEEPVLFSSSVRDNVLLGVNRERMSEAEQEQILRDALRVSSSDFAAQLPEGVDTLIGEEGLSLSGGQRQRLSLARAIAAHPRILLLDDPLSALDVRTEEAVVSMLKEHLRHTTTLLTAHRPSTVALADRVALLENGKITAIGTHQQMMRNPSYARLMMLDEQKGEVA
ncbi:ABC transporter ATP-binding protein [Rothia terrae]|uniref:ABC transporter ATP-binding protein n=1 Tax=Rothia terrae TaxID=396015 RepID=UPI002AD30DA8|nr:ABC transporter ATP-binding protein [Rothia terrae]